MNPDVRGWRIALIADALLNPMQPPGAGLPDVVAVLEASGYGLLQLPPPGDHGLLLAATADQVEEYSHHGYAVVAIGVGGEPGHGLHWRRLAPLLRNRRVIPPPRHIIRVDVDAVTEGQRLATWLSNYDLPVEEQQRWR
jgi:hypothetical protein